MKASSEQTMKRVKPFFVLPLVVFILCVMSACGSTQSTSPPSGGGALPAVPAEYAEKTNPLEGDPSAIEAGKGIYNSNCASCHGETGMGDGPAAKSLTPPPQPLAQESELTDAYLYWRIAEGGGMEPWRSAMPAWKSFLSEEQIWQVVAYLRSLMG